MAKYERANEKSGRLFITEQERLADNPKLPVLNGSIMVDGVLMYLGLWKRVSKNGGSYYTAELTYPSDEEARLKATGPATSAAAKKERDYDKAHPKSKAHDSESWQSRSRTESEDNNSDENMPF